MNNMLFKTLTAAAVSVSVLSCSKIAPPAPVLPVPTQAQIDWHKLETYAFIHYGLNTYNDMEWGFGDSDPQIFNPSDLDVDQWASTLKNAGMKGIMITVKHHDGFCLWPTEYGEYNISKSPVENGNADILKSLIEACKKQDLKIGIYISPWDRNHAQYGEAAYADYFQNQIKEVVDKYCNDIELFEFWFDGANGGDGYYGGARETRSIDPTTYYRYEEAARTIHSKFPNAMIFGGTVPTIRWIGNEAGWAGETNWAMFGGNSEGKKITAMEGNPEGSEWQPGEVDVSIRPGWFFHNRETHQLRSLGTLVDYYYQSVGRNANLLLNVPIDPSGRINSGDSVRIMKWKETIDRHFANDLAKTAKVTADKYRGRGYEAKNVTDGDWDSYWTITDQDTTGTLDLTFTQPVELNTLMLQEYIPLGQRVAGFSIKYKRPDGNFAPVNTTDQLTTIGYKRLIRFDNTVTDQIRISFEKGRGIPCINNIGAYLAPAVLDEPRITRTQEGEVYMKAAKGTSIYYTTDGSTPTVQSAVYEDPFAFAQKGVIKAIAFDPTTKETTSVKTAEMDILTSSFRIIRPQADANNKHAFDGNTSTSYYLPAKEKSLTIALGDKYTVCGLKYTPDQARWGSGPVYKYRISIDNKPVAEGEFSNIKHNPICQTISFEPTSGSTLRFDVLGIGDNTERASFSELSIITQ